MLRLILGFFLLTSCSFLGTKSSGGQHRYRYEPDFDYTDSDLRELAPGVVKVETRDPRSGKLKEIFAKDMPDLKRIGIIVFETSIQATRAGLSESDKIYPSEQGKQLITEKFLSIWDEIAPMAAENLDYVNSTAIKNSKAITQYGLEVTDYIKADRSKIEPDDITWMPSGKKTPMYTIMNPRGMRDLSFLLIPASELMEGPKWSDANKQFVNDICKELKLDAVIVVMSDVHWTAERKDKFMNENIPEELNLRINATTLVPFGSFQARLEKLKINDRPAINVAYRYHEGRLNIPIKISLPEDQQNFDEIEKRLLDPMFKAYRDLTFMVIDRMASEMRKTH
ncbi:MAG: hypothetical protein ACJ76H_11145 [Bacteriovoracaceae bacterium]